MSCSAIRKVVALIAVGAMLATGATVIRVTSNAAQAEVNEPQQFSDVSQSNRFSKHINWLAGAKIAMGFADGTYGPKRVVTRGAMSAFLKRAVSGVPLELPPMQAFTDVDTNHGFFKTVSWLRDTGVGKGYSDGSFKPTRAVTRGAMAAFLYRASGSPSFSAPSQPTFSDVPRSHGFFKQIEWLADAGVTTGVSGTSRFAPGGTVTRETMAAFLWRFERWGFAGSLSPTSTSATQAVEVTATSETSVDIAWQPVVGATAYEIFWSRSTSDYLMQHALVGSEVGSATITGLRPGISYRFYVNAVGIVDPPALEVSASTQQVHTLNVATMNIVASNAHANTWKAWKNRRDEVWELGNSRRPDVIGMQETHNGKVDFSTGESGSASWGPSTPLFYKDVVRNWTAADGTTPYEVVNGDRYFNCSNQYRPNDPSDYFVKCFGQNYVDQDATGGTRIAYNPTTVTPVRFGGEIYGNAPSSGEPLNAPYPPYLAWAVFEQVATGKQFFFANLHFEKSAAANLSALVRASINSANTDSLPVIVVGDFAVTQWDTEYSASLATFLDSGYVDVLGSKPSSWSRKNTGLGTAYTGAPNCNSTNGFKPQYRLARETEGQSGIGKCSGYRFSDTQFNGGNVDYILTKGISRVPVWETVLNIDGSGLARGQLPSDHVMLRAEVVL